MKIHNTSNPEVKPSIVMLVYGQGGVGKTTFSATAPKPIIADCENGSKYFGLRGINVDVADIKNWEDIKEFYKYVSTSDHETIVIDPIGELMEKLKLSVLYSNNKKFVQPDGSMTMNGWGELKDRMRNFIKSIRDLNKHVILIAHVEEKDDEGKIIKRPKTITKISEELIAMVDVVGFMEVIKSPNDDGEMTEKRIIRVQPSDKYESKDRTGQLGSIIEPNFVKIINACQGTETYKWSSQKAISALKDKESKLSKDEKKEEIEPSNIEKNLLELEDFEPEQFTDSLFEQFKKSVDEIQNLDELKKFYIENKGKGKEYDAYILEKYKQLKQKTIN